MDQYTPQYSASAPRYNAPATAPKHSGWNMFVRIFVWIFLVLSVIFSLVGAISVIALFSNELNMAGAGVLVGVIVLVFGVLLAFASVAMIMIYLDMSSDIRAIRQAVEKNNR